MNAVNRAKYSSQILTAVDGKDDGMYNTQSCILMPSASRFIFSRNQNIDIIVIVKEMKKASKKQRKLYK